MLGPAQGVHDGHHLAWRRGFGYSFPNLEQPVLGCATDAAGHIRRVAAVMLLEQVVYTAWMAERRIDQRVAVLAGFIEPAALVRIGARFGVVAIKQAVSEAVLLLHDERQVGVVAHVLVLNLVI